MDIRSEQGKLQERLRNLKGRIEGNPSDVHHVDVNYQSSVNKGLDVVVVKFMDGSYVTIPLSVHEAASVISLTRMMTYDMAMFHLNHKARGLETGKRVAKDRLITELLNYKPPIHPDPYLEF